MNHFKAIVSMKYEEHTVLVVNKRCQERLYHAWRSCQYNVHDRRKKKTIDLNRRIEVAIAIAIDWCENGCSIVDS